MTRIARLLGATALIAGSLIAGSASAATYVSNFSNLGTQGDPGSPGYYYFTTHSATQTFGGTGLSSVTGLTLQTSAGVNGMYGSEPITFGFTLNGVSIGSTTFNVGDSAARLLNFSFGAIASGSQSYTLLASVTQGVCGGCGAIQFSINNPLTLTDANVAAVPEPATWAMMMIGFGAMGASVRYRQRRKHVAYA